eukprot:285398-Prorocentrum_minimum.AAC.2
MVSDPVIICRPLIGRCKAFVVDFDDTCSEKDTISNLVEACVQATVRVRIDPPHCQCVFLA